jgi:hypothetical protein
MNRNEHRRLRLLELRKWTCGGVTARLAEKIGRSDGYVSRMLYEEGKKGKKGIGIELLNVLEDAFNLCPGWFDLPLGTPLMTTTVAGGNTHHVAEPTTGVMHAAIHHIIWPFALTSYGRVNALQRALGSRGYGEALKDLDNQLDIVLTKWERVAAEKRTRAEAA